MSEQLYLLSFPGADNEQVKRVAELIQDRVNETDIADGEVVIVGAEVEPIQKDELLDLLENHDD